MFREEEKGTRRDSWHVEPFGDRGVEIIFANSGNNIT